MADVHYQAGPDVHCKLFIRKRYEASARRALALMPTPYSDTEVIGISPGDVMEGFMSKATEEFGLVLYLTIEFSPRHEVPKIQKKLQDLNVYNKVYRNFHMDIHELKLVSAPVDLAKQLVPGIAGCFSSGLTAYATNLLNTMQGTASTMPGYAKLEDPAARRNSALWMREVASAFFDSYQRVEAWLGGGHRMTEAYMRKIMHENK